MPTTPPRPRTFPRALLLACLVPLAGGLAGCGGKKLSAEDRAQRISVHTESAALYINMGEFERAVDQAQRGLELDPENFLLRLYLGRSLQKIGGTNEILAAEKVFRSLPAQKDFRVPLGLAEVLERKGLAFDEAADAIAAGQRFTQAVDREARVAELRAQARAAWEESNTRYEAALALEPGDLEILAGLARVAALDGRFERSLEWAAVLLETLAGDRRFWRARLEQPNLAPADQERILRQVRVLDDLAITVRRKAASLERELGRPAAALAQLDAVLELDPTLAAVHAARAQVLASLGRHREAIVAIDRFLEHSGHLPFESPDVQQAYRLRTAWERAVLDAERGAGLGGSGAAANAPR